MTAFIAAVADTHHVVNELFMPPFFFGLLAFAILAVIGVGTLLFHNTQQAHPEASEVSPHVPYVHPGHDTHE